MTSGTGIAFIGTGFVSDYYMTTLANHPQLHLGGVWDIDPSRLQQFCDYWKVKAYASDADLLADPAIGIVVNLTPPESHQAVNRAALLADKHVYCEKPLAMTVDEARELVSLAAERGLTLAGAPANALRRCLRPLRRYPALRRHRYAAPGLCRDGGRTGLP